MKDRIEPRFPTDTSGLVEVIRGKAHSVEARVADVSATGFQVETAEPLEHGEVIRLSVDGYQMLGMVRYCNQHDATYKIGIERVDHWTGAVPADQPELLGRPAMKNALGNLRAGPLRELLSDPRLRTRKPKLPILLAFAAVLALALWGGLTILVKLFGHR